MDSREGLSRGTLIIGLLLVALGIVFLIASLVGRNVIGLWWPLFIVAVGLLFFVPLLLQEGAWGAFAIPGSVLTITGLVLLFQNLFDAWQTWAYAWALIAPFGVGLGIYIFGVHASQRQLRDAGGVVMRIGLILFLVFGFFFEGILGITGNLGLRLVWPILLILVGLWIILRPAVGRRPRGSNVYPGGYEPPQAGPSVYVPSTPPVWPSPTSPVQQMGQEGAVPPAQPAPEPEVPREASPGERAPGVPEAAEPAPGEPRPEQPWEADQERPAARPVDVPGEDRRPEA